MLSLPQSMWGNAANLLFMYPKTLYTSIHVFANQKVSRSSNKN